MERLRQIWNNMMNRCYRAKNKDYKYYGGRGIKVCSEWAENINAFYDWALDNGYRDDLTIDRIDNDGDYAPYNCRWVDRSTQRLNNSQIRNVTINGVTMPIKHWCKEYGINYDMVIMRIHRGMDDVTALLTPPRR